MKTLCLLCLVVAMAVGCATKPPPPPPLALSDVISMAKAGTSDDEIINRLTQTRTVIKLSSDNIVMLRNEGVSERVVNYMLDSYTQSVANAQSRQRSSSVGWGVGFGSGSSGGGMGVGFGTWH